MKTAASTRRFLIAYQIGAFVLAALLAMLVTACAGGPSGTAAAPTPTPTPLLTPVPTPTAAAELPTFTAAQLAPYDGQDGQPAYIAVKGVVYDVSKVPQWSGGKHNGHSAGKDVSSAFPHPASFLKDVPVVGTYVG